MILLKATNIVKSYAERTLLKLSKLEVHSGERIGIVGQNGSGKSTLMNILAGEDKEIDKGQVELFCTPSYFHQFNMEDSYDTEKYISEHTELSELFRLRNITNMKNLSGGEITKILLSDTMSKNSELVFLDEPTSNLDITSINILEEQIRYYYGAVVIISHDRQFLENLCTKIIEIENGEVNIFNCSYNEYVEIKRMRMERIEFEYEQYRKEKKRLEKAAAETTKRASSMKGTPKRMGNSEARLHRRGGLEKQEKIEGSAKALKKKLEHLQSEAKEKPLKKREIGIELAEGTGYKGKNIIECENISIDFGDKILFENASFFVRNKSKTALIGDNGTGKTTLIKKILGEDVVSGSNKDNGIIRLNAKKTAYYNQKLDILNNQRTVLENVTDASPFNELHARNILGRLNIREDDVYKKVEYLSGGERVKVCFAKIFTSGADLVILDEPTNYIDSEVSDLLKNILLNYEGTVFIVSHDRYFLRETAENVIEIKNGILKQHDISFAELFPY